MPFRNVLIIAIAGIVSIACYFKAQRNPLAAVIDQAMDEIADNYVDEVDRRDLFEGAMEGMVAKLDQHSTYIDPTTWGQFQQSLKQEFGGIGVELTYDKELQRLTVISPIVGTPAYNAGIVAGDVIMEIDGADSKGIELQDAVHLLRGQPGTDVVLGVRHADEEEVRTVEITRAKIQVDSVLGDWRDADGGWRFTLKEHPRIGYIRLTSFGEHSSEEIGEILEDLNVQADALILDLRNNPGGLLDAATKISDMFIDSGKIVTTRSRVHGSVTARASPEATIFGVDKPMVVLVNNASASASEIVAACLQDHNRAKIGGQRSWGKGTVQNLVYLEQGQSCLKLTTATYHRPSGRNIHRQEGATEADDWGVRPDDELQVVLEPEVARAIDFARRKQDIVLGPDAEPEDADEEPVVDPQLQKAVEYLLKQLDR